ncbi:MAG: tetratricopeptide repeat protein [Bacteroidota bacterium]
MHAFVSLRLAVFLALLCCFEASHCQTPGNPLETDSLTSQLAPLDSLLVWAEKEGAENRDSVEQWLEQAGMLVANQPIKAVRYSLALAKNRLEQHRYYSSLSACDEALNYGTLLTDAQIRQLNTMRGSCHYFLGNHELAIQAYLVALDHCLEPEKDRALAAVYNGMARVYISLQDWPQTKKYLELALAAADQGKNTREGIRARGNMGILFAMQGDMEKSENWFLESIAFTRSLGDSLALAKAYNNIGVMYERSGDLDKCLENYQIGLRLAERIDDKASIAIGYQNVGQVLKKLGRYPEAKRFFDKGLSMSQQLGNRDILRDGLYAYADLLGAMGDFEQALDIVYRGFDLNDSLTNEEHRNAVSELEIRYETEKKEREILALSQAKLENEAKIAARNAWIRWLVLGLLTLVGLFLAAFIIYRQRIENQKQKELIEAILDTQMAERKRIAQDLHDSIGGSLALAGNNLQKRLEGKGLPEKELESTLDELRELGQQVRQISHNLMPGELVRFGLVSAVQDWVDELSHESLDAQLLIHGMEKRLEPVMEIQIFRMIQEIVQNVLKHAKAQQMTIYLNRHPQMFNLMVEDNGQGMNQAEKKKHEGIGLKSIRARVDYLQGEIILDSTPGQGTTINIQIPLT